MTPSLLSEPLTPERIAGTFDHAILQPTFTDQQMQDELASLRQFPLASVCIKPYFVRAAVEALKGTSIAVGTVIGFPHGSPLPSIKAAEAEQAFVDGARDVDMVVNVGKVLSADWAYVKQDIEAVLAVARRHGGVLKVIFETDFLTEDAHKIRLCEICSELKVDFVKTSTGYGFVKGADGKYSYIGANEHDLRLMRKHSAPEVGVKASGGVRTLDDVLKAFELGATRIGTASTAAIMKEAHARFGKGEGAVVSTGTATDNSY